MTQPVSSTTQPEYRAHPQDEAYSQSHGREQDALPAGSTLQAGSLVLQQVLSQSHFGITYRGEDIHLQRQVAIKEFFPDGCVRHECQVHPHGTLSPTTYQLARNRFLDEARVLARFRHLNIVHVYSFFEEHNTAYMVMEFIEGETLLERVNRQARLNESEALEYVMQAGAALGEVHRAQLLHCDVKPDNIILQERRVILVDFGLSARLEEQENYLTRPLSTTAHFGTPGYAPLEQYTQQVALGTYTDVYALGATLYHLLTGQTPTPSVDRAYGVELVPPAQLHDDISSDVSTCVMWAMELRAEQRPQSVRRFLEHLRSGPNTAVPAVPAIAVDTPPSTPATTSLPVAHTTTPATPAIPSTTATPAQATNSQQAVPLLAPANQDREDGGCLEVLFAGFITIWTIAFVTYVIWFLINTSLVTIR